MLPTLNARDANTGDPREKPTRRDPRTGAWMAHPAYQGWRPSEPNRPRQTLARILMLAIAAVFVATLWRAAS